MTPIKEKSNMMRPANEGWGAGAAYHYGHQQQQQQQQLAFGQQQHPGTGAGTTASLEHGGGHYHLSSVVVEHQHQHQHQHQNQQHPQQAHWQQAYTGPHASTSPYTGDGHTHEAGDEALAARLHATHLGGVGVAANVSHNSGHASNFSEGGLAPGQQPQQQNQQQEQQLGDGHKPFMLQRFLQEQESSLPARLYAHETSCGSRSRN